MATRPRGGRFLAQERGAFSSPVPSVEECQAALNLSPTVPRTIIAAVRRMEFNEIRQLRAPLSRAITIQ